MSKRIGNLVYFKNNNQSYQIVQGENYNSFLLKKINASEDLLLHIYWMKQCFMIKYFESINLYLSFINFFKVFRLYFYI